MSGHDEHGDRDFRKAPRAARGAGSGEWCSSGSEASAAHRANGLPAAGAGRPAGRVFRVAPEALEHLQRRIQALGRRARRIGVEPVRLIDTGERDASGHALVLLSGRAPVLAGWTLAAIVDHRDGHATVRPVGEQGERLAAGAFAAASCEHCGLRRRRTRTYVVVHADSGEVRQVGSGCLRDFLGGPDPERACRRAELLAAARAELDRAGTLAIAPDGAGASVRGVRRARRARGRASTGSPRASARGAHPDRRPRTWRCSRCRTRPALPTRRPGARRRGARMGARAAGSKTRPLAVRARRGRGRERRKHSDAPRPRARVRADRRLPPATRPVATPRAPRRTHRGHRARRARPHATLRAARHRAPLRADRRRRKPAGVVADRRRPASPRRGRDADRPGPAPHPVRLPARSPCSATVSGHDQDLAMEACGARPGTCADDPSGSEPTPDDHTGPLRRADPTTPAVVGWLVRRATTIMSRGALQRCPLITHNLGVMARRSRSRGRSRRRS